MNNKNWKKRSKNNTPKPKVWVNSRGWTGDIYNGLALAHAINQEDSTLVDIGRNGSNIDQWRMYLPLTKPDSEGEGVRLQPEMLPNIIIESGHWRDLHPFTERTRSNPKYSNIFCVRMLLPDIPESRQLPFNMNLTIGFEFMKSSDSNCKNFIHLPSVPSRINQKVLDENKALWENQLSTLTSEKPMNLVILGERSDDMYELSIKDVKKLGKELGELIRKRGGSLAISTSPRTKNPEKQIELLTAHLPKDTPFYFYDYSKGGDNPYLGLLAHADTIVLTDDSMSMLSDAMATGKPRYIFKREPHVGDEPAFSPTYAKKMIEACHAQPFDRLLHELAPDEIDEMPAYNSADLAAKLVTERWKKHIKAQEKRGVV